jgi:DNA-binding transcriptional ArsR family regulator
MRESQYRESRVCRVLGNPVVYNMVGLLEEKGPMSPSAMAKVVQRRLQTVSEHLARLRAVDLVRYDRKGGQTRYWLKHGPETKRILAALAAFVHEAGPFTD